MFDYERLECYGMEKDEFLTMDESQRITRIISLLDRLGLVLQEEIQDSRVKDSDSQD